MVSLDKLTTNGKALFLAYDQGLEHGPTDFNDENIDPGYVLKIGVEGAYNAIIFQKGIAEKYYKSALWAGDLPSHIPLIVKLNGKTNLVTQSDPFSPLLCTVDEAVEYGAMGVGYTIYVGSEHEDKMTSEFAQVVRDAHNHDLPVLAWMYPRGKAIDEKWKTPEGRKELTAYAARLGMELGADIVKIQYPGSLEALKWVVEAAGKTKVVVSGGSKEDEDSFYELAKTVMQSGAMGMAVGRNIWQHENPLEITSMLKQIIFGESKLHR